MNIGHVKHEFACSTSALTATRSSPLGSAWVARETRCFAQAAVHDSTRDVGIATLCMCTLLLQPDLRAGRAGDAPFTTSIAARHDPVPHMEAAREKALVS